MIILCDQTFLGRRRAFFRLNRSSNGLKLREMDTKVNEFCLDKGQGQELCDESNVLTRVRVKTGLRSY